MKRKRTNRIGRASAEVHKIMGFASAWRAYPSTDEAEERRRAGVIYDTAKKAAELLEDELENCNDTPKSRLYAVTDHAGQTVRVRAKTKQEAIFRVASASVWEREEDLEKIASWSATDKVEDGNG